MTDEIKTEILNNSRYLLIVPADLNAKTSKNGGDCESCYAGQQFSPKLQQFMIDYSVRVSSKNPITDKP